jgi:hypothetical protein
VVGVRQYICLPDLFEPFILKFLKKSIFKVQKILKDYVHIENDGYFKYAKS